jgi:hypothetical protein
VPEVQKRKIAHGEAPDDLLGEGCIVVNAKIVSGFVSPGSGLLREAKARCFERNLECVLDYVCCVESYARNYGLVSAACV